MRKVEEGCEDVVLDGGRRVNKPDGITEAALVGHSTDVRRLKRRTLRDDDKNSDCDWVWW